MPSVRLIEPDIAIPRYRQLRMPVVAAELAPFADVSVNDENVEALDFSPVDLAGLTCQTYNADRAFFIADQFRERGIPTLLGGVFATAMPQKALEHFDAVVVGELEGLGETIIRDLSAGNLQKVYQSPAPPDLSHTRAPRWDLLKSRKYYHVNFPVETTRGCPHQCRFCFSSFQYPGFRKRSLSDIERDLGERDHGLVEVVDLHFAADRDFAIEVCGVFANMGVPGWYGEATLKSLDDDRLLAALEKSNCRQMFVGLEAVSPRALSAMNKDFNRVDDFRRVIARAQNHGIFIHAGFIWGVPGQTPADFDATLRFCEDVNLYLASSNILTPYPGTPWHEELRARGRILSEDFRDYDSAHVVADPETMTPAQVVEGIVAFNRKFYSFGSAATRAFQAPNKNLMILTDYFGFQSLYRAYYEKWGKRALKGVAENPPPPLPEGRPRLFRNIPWLYALFNLSWRYWEFWFVWWAKQAEKPGVLFAGAAGAAWIGAVALAWPHAARPPGLSAGTGLYALLSFGAVLASRVVGARLRSGPTALVAGHVLWLPAYALPLAWPGQGLSPQSLAAFLNVVLFLKNTSFFLSPDRAHASLFRYSSFLYWSPTLGFGQGLVPDPEARLFDSAWVVARGYFALLLTALALSGLVVFVMRFGRPGGMGPGFFAFTLLKGLYWVFLAYGFLTAVSGGWRAWGFHAEPAPGHPLAARTLSGFWKNLNRPYSVFMAGRNPLAAFLLSGFLAWTVFLASGITEAPAPYGLGESWPSWALLLAFFGLQGLYVLAEKRLTANRAASRALTMIFLYATSPFFLAVSDRLVL